MESRLRHMVCRACRLLLTTAFHKQVKMPSAGYVWINLSRDALPARLSPSRNSSHIARSLWEQHLSCFFAFLFYLSLPLKALSAHRHASLVACQSCAALGSQCILQSGHGTWHPFMCASPIFSLQFCCSQFPQCSTVFAADDHLLSAWQGCRPACTSSDTNELSLK